MTKPEMLEEHPSSKQLEANSMAARSMLREENDFLLRDLKSVEESMRPTSSLLRYQWVS